MREISLDILFEIRDVSRCLCQQSHNLAIIQTRRYKEVRNIFQSKNIGLIVFTLNQQAAGTLDRLAKHRFPIMFLTVNKQTEKFTR